MTIDDATLRLSAQRALLYSVPRSAILISIEHNASTLLMRAVLDGPISDEARDDLYSAAGEMVGDFPDLFDSKVEFLERGQPGAEAQLRLLVFAMSETGSQ